MRVIDGKKIDAAAALLCYELEQNPAVASILEKEETGEATAEDVRELFRIYLIPALMEGARRCDCRCGDQASAFALESLEMLTESAEDDAALSEHFVEKASALHRRFADERRCHLDDLVEKFYCYCDEHECGQALAA